MRLRQRPWRRSADADRYHTVCGHCGRAKRARAEFPSSTLEIAVMRSIVVIATFALLAACSALPPPLAGPDPSDPSARVAAVGYRSTIGPYTSQRPVEPMPWQQQNERVAPAPRQ
jgi:hypothetical protein